MTLTIYPTSLTGAVTPPASKSQAHRVLIAAALAEGDSLIMGLDRSDDIDATLRCLEELGAEFEESDEGLVVHGIAAGPMSPRRRMALPHLDCGESGSTLRFLIPVALAVCGGGIFAGRGRLMERPLEPYFDIFKERGISYDLTDGVLTVRGELTPGAYRLPGNVSSQFFTGLLLALPLLDGPSAILPTTPELESASYIAMTCQVLEHFGVMTMATMSLPPQYHVMGGSPYRAARVEVEKDWSQAAIWHGAAWLGDQVSITRENLDSLQGDAAILRYCVMLEREGELTLDLSGNPDLAPILALMAALRKGTTHLVNAGRLRLKESDRLAAICKELCKLGADVEEGEDSLTLTGVERLSGGVTVDAHNDHRIAMMLAIAATRCTGPITLTGAESVSKSYPSFWEDYVNLGGRIEEAGREE